MVKLLKEDVVNLNQVQMNTYIRVSKGSLAFHSQNSTGSEQETGVPLIAMTRVILVSGTFQK